MKLFSYICHGVADSNLWSLAFTTYILHLSLYLIRNFCMRNAFVFSIAIWTWTKYLFFAFLCLFFIYKLSFHRFFLPLCVSLGSKITVRVPPYITLAFSLFPRRVFGVSSICSIRYSAIFMPLKNHSFRKRPGIENIQRLFLPHFFS